MVNGCVPWYRIPIKRKQLHLLGARCTFEIWTDHQNLQHFRKPQKLNRRQARWQTELQEYDFLLVHKPGAQMKKADLLTRRADFKMGKDDNRDIVLLKEGFFVGNIQVEPIAEDLMRRIQKAKANRDRAVAQPEWVQREDGTVTWKERVYVPEDARLREDIVRLHHDSPLAGHPGRYKTHELITRNYWWPGIQRDIRKYVQGCEKCQRVKPTH